MRNQKGMSLVEMLITFGLVGVIGLVVMNVTQQANQAQKKSNTKMDEHSDLVTLENVLSPMISSLNLQYTFTGRGLPITIPFPPISIPTPFESRFLIPLSNQCRDLSTCPNDTSLMFVNHKLKNNPAVDMLCSFNSSPLPAGFLNPPNPNQANFRIFVFDQNKNTYGSLIVDEVTSKITTAGISGSFNAGIINLNEGDIFTLFEGPKSSLWRVAGAIQKLTGTDSQILSSLQPQANCINRLQNSSILSNIYYIYAAPLKPNHLAASFNFPTQLKNQSYKLFNTEILSIGRLATDNTLSVNKCKWDQITSRITCLDEFNFPKIKNVQISRLDEEFRVALDPSPTIKWYDIGEVCNDPNLCNIGSDPLLTFNPTSMEGLIRINNSIKETEGKPILLESNFSFYKQIFINRFRFRFKQGNRRRDLYVPFY